MLGINFWKLWLSGTVSSLGDGVRYTAIPLLAAAYTRNPLLLSVVGIAAGLPWLLFAVPLGAMADRYPRRTVMLVSHAVRAVAAGLFTIMVAAGYRSIFLLGAFTLVLGAFEVLFESASQAAVPTVVAPEHLTKANSRLGASIMLFDEFLGPLVGATLFGVAALLPFGLDTVSFVAAAVLLMLISSNLGAPDSSRAKTTLRQDVAEGARWLRGSTLVKLTILSGTFLNLARAATLAILVLYSLEDLRTGNLGFALLNTALAAGSLIGSWLAGWLGRHVPERVIVLGGPLVVGMSYLLMGGVVHPVAVGIGMAILGFATMNWNIVVISLRQRVTPNRLLGRVGSLTRLIAWGAMPLGALLGGLLADWSSPRTPFLISGVMLLAVAAGVALLARRVVGDWDEAVAAQAAVAARAVAAQKEDQ